MKQQRRDQGQINSLSDSWLSCSRDRASQLQIQHVQTADNWSVMTNVSTHSCVSPDPCVYKAVLECKRKKKKVWTATCHGFFCVFSGTMVNPGGSSQPPPVGTGSLSWKRCAGCGGKIADRFLLYTMDSYWHSRCLKCSCCQAQLGEIGTSCYTKSGMILCRNDYIRWGNHQVVCSVFCILLVQPYWASLMFKHLAWI